MIQCKHEYISFEDQGLDGQTWWCDAPNCDIQKPLIHIPDQSLIFPPNSYIRPSGTNHYL